MSLTANITKYKNIALFNNSSTSEGFENCVLFGNLISQPQVNSNGFFFCNYDHKNKIEDLTSKRSSRLKFDDLVFFKPEKKISLEEFKTLSVPIVNTSQTINLNSKTSKTDY